PEGRQCFPNLTVHEHLVAFAACRNGVAEPWTPARLYALFPRLAERAGHLGNQLSSGEQQMLAIGRALMLNPELLILDDPSEGLAPVLVDELGAILRDLAATGVAILLIEQHLRLVRDIAERYIVPGETADSALMFLPSEAVYAELHAS
ncbi:ATP-binding cassette domain-containing protein, partial [Citrobacter sp. AAK_AS5]